jgi:hypothetical protein
MDQKSQSASAADAASSTDQTASSVTSMNELLEKLPAHVRISQRRGATTAIVGYPSPPK